ncbi:MAG: redoxin domain-containing protein [Phycisphaeraceae bacterium]|nr:redoxin domain-containing protein [Phycisphaeraceae bacterium]MCW5762852.1 redoxin domain-containing protein [Phycisphaeraceae bacterium]
MPLPLAHLDACDGWLNIAAQPPRATDFLGRAVIVHFWDRANLQSIDDALQISALARHHHSRGLVVIGVHVPSPGAPASRRIVRAATLQAGITHPIALDTQGRIARALSIRRLPTTLFIDPAGNITAQLAGEHTRQVLERTLGQLTNPVAPINPAIQPVPEDPFASPSGLRWPTAVLAQTPSIGRDGRLFISDTNSSRVIIADWPDDAGSCRATWIINREGTASLGISRPRGLAFDAQREILYIADSGSHRILRANLRDHTVSTLLGDATPGTDRIGGSSGEHQPINTPSDLALDPTRNKLFIAMTGLHQIWALDLSTLVAKPVIGTGDSGVIDGPANVARLARPAAVLLTPDRKRIIIADAQGPAIREVELADRTVRTIIGTPAEQVGTTLSIIGNRDGVFPDARLAMPTALADWIEPNLAAVLDTDNNTVRIIDPNARSITTLHTPMTLHQPQGIALAQRLPSATTPTRLFIADTAAHRILQFDPASNTAHELRISGLAAPGDTVARIPPHAERAAMNTPLGRPLDLEVGWTLPEGFSLSDQEPVVIRITAAHRDDTLDQVLVQRTCAGLPGTLTVPIVQHDTVLLVELALAVEHRTSPRCNVLAHAWRVRFGTDGGEPRLIAHFSPLAPVPA